ncbi:undecaprenyldiphospho-muramoylpentapeptide beta-N-acetylglucosaminyltransferase [Ligilactobacillus ceti]|uniref:UDP-N-acetylglucosamine--N-acetylmuramyl-(pentapeptide) pyrophosphoryl-undecaprenol N-acetylglucosamine transferase n=1 Tax=Ligilactobacillus ceti DSM 22408 TaxID=1122146 RepID=A0A0R2KHU8_9LACO|nr:undecaprenyldiphospho-muramoylpentapeptide beta-N-acetylglucosaminyltransferase [Ligilactobacillus ceti]KRN88960.1 n-acetylglucosamine transferase [Ligilactobacillus ceti DSM 22408]
MRLLISGGGTGGHIYPALALIEALKAKDPKAEILYVGTAKGLESKIVPNAGIPLKTIEIQGFKRSLSLDNFKTIQLFFKSVADSKKIIKEFKPDVVVGTGGYVCGPVVYAAAKLKIPTFIHEQNSVAGITNKFLSRYANKVGICFADAASNFPQEKVVFTGNPRAQQVVKITNTHQLQQYGLVDGKKTVLVFGGSRGALKINQTMLAAMPLLSQVDFQVLFVTGQVHYDKIKAELDNMTVPENVKVVPYINDMPAIFPEISCIVGRAGATSLAEVTALGIPSVLIPSPYVTNDHQTKNAQSLVKLGAAKLITEQELNAENLVDNLQAILNDEQTYQQMSEQMKTAGKPQAADQVLAVLEEISQ